MNILETEKSTEKIYKNFTKTVHAKLSTKFKKSTKTWNIYLITTQCDFASASGAASNGTIVANVTRGWCRKFGFQADVTGGVQFNSWPFLLLISFMCYGIGWNVFIVLVLKCVQELFLDKNYLCRMVCSNISTSSCLRL